MKIHEYNEMMAYLTRPGRTGFNQGTKKVAGLMEEYYGKDELKYQEAVKNGFQGTFEEYLQWMRKNAAQGGVIGKGGMFQGEDMGYRTGFWRTVPGTSKKISNRQVRVRTGDIVLGKKLTKEQIQALKGVADITEIERGQNAIKLIKEYENVVEKALKKGDLSKIGSFAKWAKDKYGQSRLKSAQEVIFQFPNVKEFYTPNANDARHKLIQKLITTANAGENFVEMNDILRKVLPESPMTGPLKIQLPEFKKYTDMLHKREDKVRMVFDNIVDANETIAWPKKRTSLSDFHKNPLTSMIAERTGVSQNQYIDAVLDGSSYGNKNFSKPNIYSSKNVYPKDKLKFAGLSKIIEYGLPYSEMLEEVDYRIGGNVDWGGKKVGATRSPSKSVNDFALRHWNYHKKYKTENSQIEFYYKTKPNTPIEWDKVKTNKNKIKSLKPNEVFFRYIKDPDKKWDMDSLGKDGRKTKYFKEVYDKKRALLDLAEKPVKNPFGKGMITVEELIKKVNKQAYGWNSSKTLELLHGPKGVAGDPFKNIGISTRDINVLENGIAGMVKSNTITNKQANDLVKVMRQVSSDDPQTIINRNLNLAKKIKAGQLKPGSYKDMSGAIRSLLETATKPQIMKIRKILGCMSEGGRVGLQGGGNLLECPMKKFAENPEAVLNKVGQEMPETRTPIMNAFKNTLGAPLRWGGKAFSFAGKTLSPIATPFGAGAIWGLTGFDKESAVDRAALGAEAAFAPELVKMSSKITKPIQNQTMRSVVRGVLNAGMPLKWAMKAARIASPIGWASLGIEGVYQLGKYAMEEQKRFEALSPEEQAGERAEQEEMAQFSAAEGGRVGFDGGGSPLQKLRQEIVDSMRPYAPGDVTEDQLQLIVKDITLDMTAEQAQASAKTNFIKLFGMASGGRVGFDEGSKPKSPGRRAFIKGITALAAIPIVGKYFKLGKVLERASTYTGPAIDKVKGMPEWFPGLVKKLWNEGEDVTKTYGYEERLIVKKGTLEGGDEVNLYYHMDSGDVSIDVTGPQVGKGGKQAESLRPFPYGETSSGAYNQEYGLRYKKGQMDETTKGKKPPDEFTVDESELHRSGPEPDDVDWYGNETSVDGAISDLTELEAFAKNKTVKQIHKKKGTKPKDVRPSEWEVDWDDIYDPYD